MFILTYSSMNMLRSCPRKFELSILNGIKTKSSMAMTRGSLVHAEIENRIKNNNKTIQHDDPFILASVLGLADAALQKISINELRDSLAEIEIKREFNNFTIAGKIDIYDGHNMITDFKVTARADMGAYLTSMQIAIYAWLMNLSNCMARYVIIPQPSIKPKNGEQPDGYRTRVTGWAADKIWIEKTPITLTKLEQVEKYIDTNIRLVEFYQNNTYPCNFDFCENVYGICQYIKICQLKNPIPLDPNGELYIDKSYPELSSVAMKLPAKPDMVYNLIQTGALRSARRQMKTMLLLKAIIEKNENRNIETSDLKRCGIVMNKMTLKMFETVRQINIADLVGSGTAPDVTDENDMTKAMELINQYNVLAQRLGLFQSKTSRKKLHSIIQSGIMGVWPQIETNIKNSMFLRGQTSNFRVSLDWLIKNYNWKKVIDGKYSDAVESS